jgi:hypothetical protein
VITKLTVALKIGADTEPFSHSLGHSRHLRRSIGGTRRAKIDTNADNRHLRRITQSGDGTILSS